MGPKKPKKTKAEIEAEKEAKAEEERKRLELEAKLAAEEAERKRIENERIAKENQKIRADEINRLYDEHMKLQDLEETRDTKFAAESKFENERIEWMKFRDPTEEIDANSEKDLNTFITLAEDVMINDIKEAIKYVGGVSHVATNVERCWAEALSRGDDEGMRRSYGFMEKLNNMILQKIDHATSYALRFVDDIVNERSEFQIEEECMGVTLGIWGSTSDMRPIRKAVQFENMGIQIDVPKQILSQDSKFNLRVIKLPIDTFSIMAYDNVLSKTLQSTRHVVGDLYYMDFLFSPSQPFSLRPKKWTIRDKSPASLQLRKSPYPTSVACKCSFKVPDTVIMTDDIRVAFWSEEKRGWTEDCLTEYTYHEETRTFQFYTTDVGILALVKDRVADAPYKSWALNVTRPESGGLKSPQYEKLTQLTISNQVNEAVIEINESTCKLVSATQNDGFADMLGVPMPAGQLLYRLQRRGINFLPTPRDVSRLEGLPTPPKDLKFELNVLEEMSKACNTLDYHCCPQWNQSQTEYIGPNRIGIMVRESCAYTSSDAFDYECILAEQDFVSQTFLNAPSDGVNFVNPILPAGEGAARYLLALGNQYGDDVKFSHEPRPDEICHLSILQAMDSRLSAEAKDRTLSSRCSVRFQRNVCLLLHLVKPISHSGPKYKLEEKKEVEAAESAETGGEEEGGGTSENATEENTESAANPAPEAPPAN